MINLMTSRRKDATLFYVLLLSCFPFFSAVSMAAGQFFDGPNLNGPHLELPIFGAGPASQEDGIQTAPQSILQPSNSFDPTLSSDGLEKLEQFDLGSVDPASFQNDDFEILTRGTLHEAFASAHNANPTAPSLVSKAPPEAIDELPPEYKPEGNNIQWIPGYWAWDDAQSDFIWISGIWRDVPPQRQWIPGYWNQGQGQYQWVSGFWSEQQSQEVGYLPAPPANLDNGPSVQSPGEDFFYVPGNWDYQRGNYRWLTGHWQPVVQNRIWIPARYVWTPQGCVFVSGYWDYAVEGRGTCFAPVHFHRPVYVEPEYVYRPQFVVNIGVDFLTHLFVRPNCGQYFFGNWYDQGYAARGYRPWCNYQSHHRRFDPLLTYYRSQRSAFDRRYSVVQYLAYQNFRSRQNQNFRPRTTLSAHQDFVRRSRNKSHYRVAVKNDFVRSLDRVRRQQDKLVRQNLNSASRNNRKLANELKRNQSRFRKLEKQEQVRIKTSKDTFVRLSDERRERERRQNQRQALDRQRSREREQRQREQQQVKRRSEAERNRNAVVAQNRNQAEKARKAGERQQRARNEEQRQRQAAARQRNSERQRIANRQQQDAQQQRDRQSRQREQQNRLQQAQASQRETAARKRQEADHQASERRRNADRQQLAKRQQNVLQQQQGRLRRQQKDQQRQAERQRIANQQRQTQQKERQRQAEAERQRQQQRSQQQRQRQSQQQQQANAQRQRQANAERQRQANAERQRKASAERQRKANAERQRQASAERQRRANDQRQRNAAKQRQQQQERQRQQQRRQKQKKKR